MLEYWQSLEIRDKYILTKLEVYKTIFLKIIRKYRLRVLVQQSWPSSEIKLWIYCQEGSLPKGYHLDFWANKFEKVLMASIFWLPNHTLLCQILQQSLHPLVFPGKKGWCSFILLAWKPENVKKEIWGALKGLLVCFRFCLEMNQS